MKNKKQLYILIGIAAVLVIIAVLTNINFSSSKSSYKIPTILFKVDSASIDRIDFEERGEKFTISKTNFLWRITSPVDYQANQNFVTQMISSLNRYKIVSLASDNPSNKGYFGFNDTGYVKITVYQSGSPVGSMMIGNMGSSGSHSYIKSADDDKIYLADGIVRGFFYKDKGMNEWRDLAMLSINRQHVLSLDFMSPKEHYTLVKDTATGKFHSTPKDSVNESNLNSLLSLLQNMNTQGFKDTVISPDVKPESVLTVKTKSDEYKIEFIPYSGGKENENYLIRISGIKQLFLVDTTYMNTVMRTKKDLIVQK
jgi:hypothetical protein